jgi:hypothetical protein
MRKNFTTRFALQLIALFLFAVQAHATSILIFDDAGSLQDGKVSYDGVLGHALVGTGIDFNSITGTATPLHNGEKLTCVSCELNFTTGGSTDEGFPDVGPWQFGGGGTFTVTGTAKDSFNNIIASGILVSGIWGGAVALANGFPSPKPPTQVSTLGFGTTTVVNSDLLTFFGIINPVFSFSGTNISSVTSYNNGTRAFAGNVLNADAEVDNTPAPEPNSPLLFGLGFLAMGLLGNRMKTRQNCQEARM